MVMLGITLVGILALALLTAAAMDDSPGQPAREHSNHASRPDQKPPGQNDTVASCCASGQCIAIRCH